MELFRDINSGNLEMKESWSRYLIWIHWSDEYHHHTKWGEKNSLRRTHASMHGRTHNIKAIFEDHSRWYNKMTLILLSSIHSLILCMCLCVYRVQAECECVWVCLYVYVEREQKTIEFEQSKPNRNKATIFMWASRMRAKKTRSNCFVYRSPLVRLIFHLRVLSVCSLFGFLYSAAFFHYYFQEKREECACSILNTT